MKFGAKDNPSEDMFAETRMSFGEHIEDLRKHLLRAVYWFVFFVVISFFPFIGKNVLRFIARPVELALQDYWKKYYEQRAREAMKKLNEGDEELTAFNRPVRIEQTVSQAELVRLKQALNRIGNDVPKAAPVQEFDIREALRPMFRRLRLEDWLNEGGETGSRGFTFHSQLLNPLRLIAETKRYEPFVGRRPSLSTFNVQEGFVVYFKVCLMTGFVLAAPMVFYQLWSFVAAGLYPSEKRYVNLYMPVSVALFLVGVVLCELVVIPKAVEALLWFNEWLGMEPELRLSEWLGFAIFMPVLFGISFQTPLVMLFLERLGIFGIDTYRAGRRIAWFILTIFTVIAVPSSDILSMLFLLIPLCLLYELGIWLCRWLPRRPPAEIEVPESEEMVEV
jgi:sec-independent protein translocase protein TatC